IAGRLRLKKEEALWEKDLLDAGYLCKTMENAHYYCPTEKVRSALLLLLQIGWQVVDFKGSRVRAQTDRQMQVRLADHQICVEAVARFSEIAVPYTASSHTFWMPLPDQTVGL